MRYQAVIFDFDGTLLNTLDDLADCMNAILAENAFPTHPVDAYRYFVGRGMLNLARAAAPEGTPEDVLRRLSERMGTLYNDNWAVKTRPYAGIPALLDALKQRGVRMAVFSNKPDVFTKAMAAYFFPAGVFEAVRGAEDGIPIKPDPAGAFLLAKEFALEPERFLYLGDTNTDMRTGLAAGMFTVGATWGFRPEKELTDAGAQAIVHSPDEVTGLL